MSTRRLLLVLGIVGVLGGGVYVAYRLGYLASDSDNLAEQQKVGEFPRAPAPRADAAAGWFQWRGPTRDGRAPAGPFRTDWEKNPPKQLWKVDCGGGYSSCVVTGGRLYTQDRKDDAERVVCLDAETGETLWAYTYPAGEAWKSVDYAAGPRATPTVIGNHVYAVGGAGKFLCLQPPVEPGGQPAVVWQHDLLAEFGATIPKWGVACSPLVEGELIVVQPGGKKGTIAAFDRTTGELKWASGDDPAGYSSPVAATVGGKRMIFAITGENLLAVGSDGTIHDRYSWRTDHNGNIATPLVVGDYVFISSAYQQGCALLRAEPRGDGVRFVEVYARRGARSFQNHHASSVFKDNRLYGFDGQGRAVLKCVAFDTGKENEDWEGDVGKGTLILADKHLVVQTERGDLCLVEATPDEFRLSAKVPKVLSGNNNWATPTLLGGRLYLRDDQKIVCYDVKP